MLLTSQAEARHLEVEWRIVMTKKTERLAALLIVLLPILGGAQEEELAKAASGLRFSENSGPDAVQDGPPSVVEAVGRHGSRIGNLSVSQPGTRKWLSGPVPPPAPSNEQERSSRNETVAVKVFRYTCLILGGGAIAFALVSGLWLWAAVGGAFVFLGS